MSPDANWERGLRAIAALLIDPVALKGAIFRARVGPVRQSLESLLERTLPVPVRRIHPDLSDTQLFGGLNVAASLREGRMVNDNGLADTPATLVLPMAERSSDALAARLGHLLDADTGHLLILLDESADQEEHPPEALSERLAFNIDLSGTRHHHARAHLPAPADIDAARDRLPQVQVSPDHMEQLVAIAATFGIDSMRAPWMACQTARALAALEGLAQPDAKILQEAAELVFPARATQLPDTNDPDQAQDPPPPEPEGDDATDPEAQDLSDLPDEILVEAVAAMLPNDLLSQIATKKRARSAAQGSGAGIRRLANRRGRPLPARPGRLDGRARIDVVATLRTAAPWQPLRRKARPDGPKLIIYPSDIRLKRYEDRSDRLIIFLVDASGSAAMARLAETKGAVELMLAQAYAKRDQVAVISFRGSDAEILLPPTRSLVQAKRRLAGLPGGGGTPLAAGLQAAAALCRHSKGRGLSPALALLTDGRANVALDGTPGRETAQSDARTLATGLAADGIEAVVIDAATRPGAEGRNLADWLHAHYIALPRADARKISEAASSALTS